MSRGTCAAVADGKCTIVWEESPCHGSSVRNPGSRVNRSHRFTFRMERLAFGSHGFIEKLHKLY